MLLFSKDSSISIASAPKATMTYPLTTSRLASDLSSLTGAPFRKLCIFIICLFTVFTNSYSAETDPLGSVRSVSVTRNQIFDTQSGRFSFVPKLVNAVHKVTNESVIRREIWFKKGDTITQADIDELERNLRDLDLFAEVEVTVKSLADAPGQIDLIVNTRDRLSIVFSAGGSFLGGIGEVKFSLGERNLFGKGQRLVFGYSENTEGELLGSLAYDNILLKGTDVYGGITVGQTEEGMFAGFNITDSFQHHQDNNAWSIKVSTDETKIDYYEEGLSVAEVPKTSNKLALVSQIRRGHINRYWRYGVSFTLADTDWDAATGPNASEIDVPEDARTTFLGGLITYDNTPRFLKNNWFDTLSYKQDITIGYGAQILIGAEHSKTQSNSDIDPVLFLTSWSRHEIGAHNYFGTALNSFVRLNDTNTDAWSLGLAAKWYNTALPHQTIALRFSFASADDKSGLPPQQSLGEDTGLRGYPAREFNGEQRILINAENRLRTPLKIASFEFGLLGFFDSGWVNDRQTGLGKAHTSAGIGLRIGSRAILGRGIIRVDFAYPFDDDPTRNYVPTFSLALGQVFKF